MIYFFQKNAIGLILGFFLWGYRQTFCSIYMLTHKGKTIYITAMVSNTTHGKLSIII